MGKLHESCLYRTQLIALDALERARRLPSPPSSASSSTWTLHDLDQDKGIPLISIADLIAQPTAVVDDVKKMIIDYLVEEAIDDRKA